MFNEGGDRGWNLKGFCEEVYKDLEESGWTFDGLVWSKKETEEEG